jgi:hypothetical protein
LPIRGRHDAENGRSGRLLAALVRGFHNPKGSAQALASTVNHFRPTLSVLRPSLPVYQPIQLGPGDGTVLDTLARTSRPA